LSVLLVFAVGVLILSIVMPRIQERRQGIGSFQYSASIYGLVPQDKRRGSDSEPLPTEPPDLAASETLLTKEPRPEPEDRSLVEEAT
jgi:hypothetical protein